MDKIINTHYFNTTHESGEVLDLGKEKAKAQDQLILNFFKEHAGKEFTHVEVHRKMKLKCPITSVYRAIATLTAKEELIKTNNKRPGTYGRPNYTWKYKLDANGQIPIEI